MYREKGLKQKLNLESMNQSTASHNLVCKWSPQKRGEQEGKRGQGQIFSKIIAENNLKYLEIRSKSV